MSPRKISAEDVFQYETFLFDADGVLWTGDSPVPGAIDFVRKLLELGKRVFILTNNSTKTLDQYMTKIQKIGYGDIPRDRVISPAIVLAAYLKDKPEYHGRDVYLLGTQNLKNTLEQEAGVHCIGLGPDHIGSYTQEDIMHSIDLTAKPKAVICSFDSHFSYPKLMKAANYLARDDVEFLITNEDYTFPGQIPGMVIPGSGATAACIRAVSGREDAKVFGKPNSEMADYLRRRHHIDAKTTIMFGDRLDTDIAFANSNGFTSCLVLTGVHGLADVQKADSRGRSNLVPNFIYSFA